MIFFLKKINPFPEHFCEWACHVKNDPHQTGPVCGKDGKVFHLLYLHFPPNFFI